MNDWERIFKLNWLKRGWLCNKWSQLRAEVEVLPPLSKDTETSDRLKGQACPQASHNLLCLGTIKVGLIDFDWLKARTGFRYLNNHVCKHLSLFVFYISILSQTKSFQVLAALSQDTQCLAVELASQFYHFQRGETNGLWGEESYQLAK